MEWDEGPLVGGPFGPYRQSERADVYKEYSDKLVKSGHAYPCFCPKHRLDALRDSAKKLHPPSMASYDRKCASLTPEEAQAKIEAGEEHTVRFKSPSEYPEFHDLLHGKLNLQTQVNQHDVRYDDLVLVKSDGLPTYHLANVVDDHLMKITHVIRGEEWLPSTPKHIEMYKAFGWEAPKFVHIPLLTSLGNKKLSKRSGDIGVLSLAEKGILPEAMVNFVALFGWSPNKTQTATKSSTEIYNLQELVKAFSLEGLTKGNTQVSDKKLTFLNKHYFLARLQDPEQFSAIASQIHGEIAQLAAEPSDIPSYREDIEYTTSILNKIKTSVISVEDFIHRAKALYVKPDLKSSSATAYLAKLSPDQVQAAKSVLSFAQTNLPTDLFENQTKSQEFCDSVVKSHADMNNSQVFQALRYALTGSQSGIDIPTIFCILGSDVVAQRLKFALEELPA